ncbi:MAG TPA: N-acetyltransferase [Elusimicrobia bacterium]|nr:N-acetyltransferase [Elusimicrobiota bacterium]
MFKGKKTILRAYTKVDAVVAYKLFNDEELRSLLDPSPLLPVSLAEEEAFINNAMNPKDKSKAFEFAITTLQGKYIGGCSYFNFNKKTRTVWIGISIADKKFWGKGYGSDALRTLLRLLFNELNARKVLLNVFAFNARAVACYEGLGFREEGRLKEQQYRAGKYHDDVIMALFRKDWEKA